MRCVVFHAIPGESTIKRSSDSYSGGMPAIDLAHNPTAPSQLRSLIRDLYEDHREIEVKANKYVKSGEFVRRSLHPATPSLDKLAVCVQLRALLDDAELAYAQEARDHGASWAQLGEAAGIARSSAKSRYDHETVADRRASFKKQAPPAFG